MPCKERFSVHVGDFEIHGVFYGALVHLLEQGKAVQRRENACHVQSYIEVISLVRTGNSNHRVRSIRQLGKKQA